MVMWRLKSCLRCSGDMFIGSDFEGWYEECLQCGSRHELKLIVKSDKNFARGEKELVMGGRFRKTEEPDSIVDQ